MVAKVEFLVDQLDEAQFDLHMNVRTLLDLFGEVTDAVNIEWLAAIVSLECRLQISRGTYGIGGLGFKSSL